MSIFSIFKPKPKSFFAEADKDDIVGSIRTAEMKTSGEIRVYIESKNPYISTLERAKEVFYDLKMDKTENRNAVLIYVAMKHKEIALFADEGIYIACGKEYWDEGVKNIITFFSKNHIVDGIRGAILSIGNALQEKFPYLDKVDKNELPDEIVFGK